MQRDAACNVPAQALRGSRGGIALHGARDIAAAVHIQRHVEPDAHAMRESTLQTPKCVGMSRAPRAATMNIQNGINPSQWVDSLESNFKSIAEYLSAIAEGAAASKTSAATRATSFSAKAGKAIKDHPFAAIGIAAGIAAVGIGYLVIRLLRR